MILKINLLTKINSSFYTVVCVYYRLSVFTGKLTDLYVANKLHKPKLLSTIVEQADHDENANG